MNTKLLACLVGLALLVGIVFFLVSDGRGGSVRGADDDGRAKETAAAPLALGDLAPVQDSAPERAPVVEREQARSASATAEKDAWRGELAGLMGRVVESDGTPVVGMRVALLEFEASMLFDGSMIDAREPSLQREETATDREGRFVLGGARGSAFHGLGIDLGGPRATIRVVDQALVHHERTDIGDVVLAPFGVLTGRVIDEAGNPVAGARVRAGPLPPQILTIFAYEFRSDSMLAFNQSVAGGEGEAVLEFPSWIAGLIDRLPVPTTLSAADGTFRLEGVALAQVVGGIDKRGYVGVPLGPLDLTDGEEELGSQVLKHGRTLRGVVEDPYGEPVVGAEVVAGAEIFPGVAAILQPCGVSDEEGRFELAGVAESGQVVAAARRAPHERWGTAVTARTEDVLIELEGTVPLTVKVRNEAGEPVSSARIRLRPAMEPGNGMGPGELMLLLPRPATHADFFHEVEAGRYVSERVSEGRYEVTAQVKGLASEPQRVEVRGEGSEVTLTCSVGTQLELSVIAAGSKEPIAGARACVYRTGANGFTILANGTTDAAGLARVGPLPRMAPSDTAFEFLPAETIVQVQHPLYGDHSATLEPNATSLVVALETGGTLAGRVHWGGAVPTRLYMLSLVHQGIDGFLEVFTLPRLSLTDLAGEFRVANLGAGQYRVELSERFLDKDPLGLMNEDFNPPTLYRGEVEVRNGETTQLVIDLTPTGRGATASIVGSVRLDGRGLEGAGVQVIGNESLRVETDGRGRFETPPFSIQGRVQLVIEGDVQLNGEPKHRMQLYSESFELTQDEVRQVDLDLYPLPLRVRVVDTASGAPIAGATVSTNAANRRGRRGGGDGEDFQTDASGEASLLVLEAGDYSVSASASGFGRSVAKATVSAQAPSEPVVIRLSHAVACAGHVRVDAAPPTQGRGFAYLQLQSEDGSGSSEGTMLTAPDYAFNIEGLQAGKYKSTLYLNGQRGSAGLVELGSDGERDLMLVFEPSKED